MSPEPPRSPDRPHFDPRMRGFRTRSTVEDVIASIDDRVGPVGSEAVALGEASGRVLAEEVVSDVDVPGFDRAAMDGYAARGSETFGSDAYNPATFRILGEARPGRPFEGRLGPGEAVRIATGSPIPDGADCVVPVELTRLDGDSIRVVEAAPPGRHLGRRGEDVRAGTVVLPAGRVLRPQDLGVLSALGRAEVEVRRRPVVTILVTGEELLPAGRRAEGYRFADMNSPMLAALIARDGGIPRAIGPFPDDPGTIRGAIVEAVAGSDAVLISGGSSTGPEDHAPSLVAELGEVLAHGVALRPASPSGFGVVGGVPVFLIPGNPVSALCAYDFFAGRAVRRLGGRGPAWGYRSEVLPLAEKLVSAPGRVDYARVRVVEGRVVPLATSGASILSSATRADGFVVVEADREGHPPGDPVTVWLYD